MKMKKYKTEKFSIYISYYTGSLFICHKFLFFYKTEVQMKKKIHTNSTWLKNKLTCENYWYPIYRQRYFRFVLLVHNTIYTNIQNLYIHTYIYIHTQIYVYIYLNIIYKIQDEIQVITFIYYIYYIL